MVVEGEALCRVVFVVSVVWVVKTGIELVGVEEVVDVSWIHLLWIQLTSAWMK